MQHARVVHLRDPGLGVEAVDQPPETGRSDTYDDEGDATGLDRSPHDVGIAPEQALPGGMGEHQDGLGGDLVVGGHQDASVGGSDSEQLEEVAADQACVETLGPDVAVSVDRADVAAEGGQVLEGLLVLAQRLEHRYREQRRVRLLTGGDTRAVPVADEVDLLRALDCRHSEQQGVEQREDGAVRSDSQCQGQHHCRGEQGVSSQPADRIAAVLGQLVESAREPRRATLFAGRGDVAEGQAGLALGLFSAHSGGPVVSNAHLEMELELLVELLLETATMKE